MTDQHTHEWINNPDTTTTTYRCAHCTDTTTPCHTCHNPLTTALPCCNPCITRARKVITDITHDLNTVPYHHTEILGLRAVRYDRVLVTTSDDDARLPFGLDAIIEDPEDPRIEAAKHPQTAIDILVGWAHAWANELHTTIPGDWSDFLLDHTTWAATNPDQSGWHDYLTEARRVRATIRRLLGLNPERQPAPCVHCGGRIVQDWTPHGLDDTLRCTGCSLTWRDRTWLTFANLHTLHQLPTTHPDALVTLEDARRIFPTVRRNTLNQWVSRGVLTPAVDTDGRPERDVRGTLLFRLGDITARLNRTDLAS